MGADGPRAPTSTMSHDPGLPVENAAGRAHARAASLAIEILRIGVGLVWALNLVFIVDPANDWFGQFGPVALSFGPTSLGGPGLPQYVAAHAAIFSAVVAVITTYLAVAFLLGLTTRWACLVGGIFSAVLLATQVGSTFVFPGGTDIGEHPLYMLIYVTLVVGGAGRALSVDRWIADAWARRRLERAARGVPTPARAWAASLDYRFFVTYFVAGTLIAFGITLGLMVVTPSSATPGTGPATVSYENLTVTLNSTNGWPQYTPSNFTVPAGRVVVTITDRDMPMNWSECPCVVSGTVGETERVNGTSVHLLSSANIAHSFVIPSLGLSVYSPGDSVVEFSFDAINAGSFQWFCTAPCGAGANAYTTPPMGVLGFMAGTITVT